MILLQEKQNSNPNEDIILGHLQNLTVMRPKPKVIVFYLDGYDWNAFFKRIVLLFHP